MMTRSTLASIGSDDMSMTLATLELDDLDRMLAAGEECRTCERVLAKTRDNLVGELLRNVSGFYEWTHYPQGDVYDSSTHSQYYYHAHPVDQRARGEHGHFHTFLRPLGMPMGIEPASLPDRAGMGDSNEALSHLIGISMDSYGRLLRLFTTNRWVTGETWYSAPDVIQMLDRFEMDLARPSWPLNRWLTALIPLFRPQIVALLQARDQRVDEWAQDNPDVNVFEDRSLEVTSEAYVSIDEQVRTVENERRRRRRLI